MILLNKTFIEIDFAHWSQARDVYNSAYFNKWNRFGGV